MSATDVRHIGSALKRKEDDLGRNARTVIRHLDRLRGAKITIVDRNECTDSTADLNPQNWTVQNWSFPR